MGLSVRTNKSSNNAVRNLGKNNKKAASNLEKLASGYQINRAADDASGLAITEKMRAQIDALGTISPGCEDGINLLHTADGYLNEVQDMLKRMTELSMKAANGILEDETERTALQEEMNHLGAEIDRIAETANFNGNKLFTPKDVIVHHVDTDIKYTEVSETVNFSDYFSDPSPNLMELGSRTLCPDTKDPEQRMKGDTLKTLANAVKDYMTKNSLSEPNMAKGKLYYTADGQTLVDASESKTDEQIKDAIGEPYYSVDTFPNPETKTIHHDLIPEKRIDHAAVPDEIIEHPAIPEIKKHYDAVPEKIISYPAEPEKVIVIRPEIPAHKVTVPAVDGKVSVSGNLMESVYNSLKKENNYDYNDKLSKRLVAVRDEALNQYCKSSTDMTRSDAVGKKLYISKGNGKDPNSIKATIGPANDSNHPSSRWFALDLTVTVGSEAYTKDVPKVDAITKTIPAKPASVVRIPPVEAHDVIIQEAKPAWTEIKYGKPAWTEIIPEVPAWDETRLVATHEHQSFIDHIDEEKIILGEWDEHTHPPITLQIGETSQNADKLNINIYDLHTDKLFTEKKELIGYGTKTVGVPGRDEQVSFDDFTLDGNSVIGGGSNYSAGYEAHEDKVIDYSKPIYEYSEAVRPNTDTSAYSEAVTLDITTQEFAICNVDTAREVTDKISMIRATYGAMENRLEHTVANHENTIENMSSAKSRIKDADMAKEMMEMTKNNVLTQAAQSMLAQANTQPQNILQLIQ